VERNFTDESFYKIKGVDYCIRINFLLQMIWVFKRGMDKDIFSSHLEVYNEFDGNLEYFAEVVVTMINEGVNRVDIHRFLKSLNNEEML